MLCSTIIQKLEELSPSFFAEDWDNVGLLAGRREKDIHTVLLALDASDAAVAQAVKMDADMLITHHPLIFRPLKRINTDDIIGARVVKLIQSDINYFAMHTNYDIKGMAASAAELIGIKDGEILQVTSMRDGIREGFGRRGTLPATMTLRDLSQTVKDNFSLKTVRVYGDLDCPVSRVCIVPGSGSDMIPDAVKAGLQVMITGDLKHHEAVDALAEGLSLIDAGHFGLEHIFASDLKGYLDRELPELKVSVLQEKDPFQVL